MVNQVRCQLGMAHRVVKGADVARVSYGNWFALLGPFPLLARLAIGPEPCNMARPQRAHNETHAPYTVSGFLADLESFGLLPVLSSLPKMRVNQLGPLLKLAYPQPPVNPAFFVACSWWGSGQPLVGQVPTAQGRNVAVGRRGLGWGFTKPRFRLAVLLVPLLSPSARNPALGSQPSRGLLQHL